jgi:DNA-binding transcriptional regulator YdaS (Cro superfamily)
MVPFGLALSYNNHFVDSNKQRVYTRVMNPLERAVQTAGSATELARLLKVDPQNITNWRARGVPASRCLAIEDVTKSAVTRYDLRPDVFGDSPTKTRKRAA